MESKTRRHFRDAFEREAVDRARTSGLTIIRVAEEARAPRNGPAALDTSFRSAAETGPDRHREILLADHLKTLKLPTFLREYEKLARQCAADGLDHVQVVARGSVPTLGVGGRARSPRRSTARGRA